MVRTEELSDVSLHIHLFYNTFILQGNYIVAFLQVYHR